MITDLREIKLPVVGIVTLSFVPTLAALAVFGLWPALLVAAVSGLATTWFTRSPEKVLFNVGNYVLSTFLAGLLYLALVPTEAALLAKVLPIFAATAVDFFANTIVLAGVIALATHDHPVRIWRRNYQWGLPSYMTGASLALLVAWLYVGLGIAGLLLGLPPLYLIYYSYDVYVTRARERESFSEEIASFKGELAISGQLHEDLRSAQLKVAAEIERARRIQHDLLPAAAPVVKGLEIECRMEFLGEMGGDYYDFVEYDDGRLGIVCGDVMGKGLSAALIMAMSRSLLHSAATAAHTAEQVLAEVNDALARDLQGQRMPYFLTLCYAVFDPQERTLRAAGGGHNPLLLVGAESVQRIASRGAALGVRTGLQFPGDAITAAPGDLIAFFTDGITEARAPGGELFGIDRLCAALAANRDRDLAEILTQTWDEMATFRAGTPATDDATLLLARLT
jgi:serine phosphatase RsbU (regulator of sigma subunit)